MLVVRGDAEYMAIGDKLDDAQFVEQRRLAAQEIAQGFPDPAAHARRPVRATR